MPSRGPSTMLTRVRQLRLPLGLLVLVPVARPCTFCCTCGRLGLRRRCPCDRGTRRRGARATEELAARVGSAIGGW